MTDKQKRLRGINGGGKEEKKAITVPQGGVRTTYGWENTRKKIYEFAVITFSHGGQQITPIGCFLAEKFLFFSLFLRYNKSNTGRLKKKGGAYGRNKD